MTIVTPKDGESVEAMLKRFTKKVAASGIIQEVKARQAYEKPSDRKRKAKAAAIARIKKQQKKKEQQIAYENENKFRPRKRFDKDRPPRENKDGKDNKKPYVAKDKKPYVPKSKPISAEAISNLQKKFNKKG